MIGTTFRSTMAMPIQISIRITLDATKGKMRVGRHVKTGSGRHLSPTSRFAATGK